MLQGLPAHYGLDFTPTHHSKVAANVDPSKTVLPKPFVVVVTGAGKGIGYHIAIAFARAGATGISISARTASNLDALEKAINELNPSIEVLKSTCNVQSEQSLLSVADEVNKKWGRVDVVVANAGIMSRYIDNEAKDKVRLLDSNLPIGILEDQDWNEVLDVNFAGVYRTAKAFAPLLRDTKDGPQTFISNSSVAAHSEMSIMCPVAYNMSKFACNRLVEYIDADHREKDGIHAYAMHFGGVVTDQTKGHRADGDFWTSLFVDDIDLAGAVCVWLAKEKRSWLSGRYLSANWDVDELEAKKEEILEKNLLKYRMTV